MLCRKCQSVASVFWSLLEEIELEEIKLEEIEHHSTYAELQRAVQQGCKVCRLFQYALLQDYAHELSWSLSKAAAYHYFLDQPYTFKAGVTHKVHCKPRVAFLRRRKARPKHRVPSKTAFYVCPVTLDRSTLSEDDIRGILYLRKARGPMQDPFLAVPFLEVYPYLGLSSRLDIRSMTGLPIVGRTLPVTAEISLAKSWINDCILNHPLCLTPRSSPLPTRVLDLWPSSSPENTCLIHSNGIHARYAALSHCWGGYQPVTLTSSRMPELLKHIALSSLPKTLRDAVTVTKALDLRYLWIDCLCIIQDDQLDWEIECAKMTEVYKNATVTLAGPAAINCYSGLLNDRISEKHEHTDFSVQGTSARVVLSYLGHDQYVSHFHPELNSTWATRAWILQERLLSSRILYFGSNKMYLECFTNVRFDNCHCPVEWDDFTAPTVGKRRFSQFQNNSQRFEYWDKLVSTYSSLLLTVQHDRLPALSGIVSDLQLATNSQYLAGLWRDNLPRGLCWHVMRCRGEPILEPFRDYIAPSWSWASNPYKVSYLSYNYSHRFQEDLEILDHQVTPAGVNPYGKVKSGFLEVRGRVRFCAIAKATTPRKTRKAEAEPLDVSIDNQWAAFYAPDYPSSNLQTPFNAVLLYIGRFPGRGTAAAMVIETVPGGHNHCKRIGLAFTPFDAAGTRKFIESFNNKARIPIRII